MAILNFLAAAELIETDLWIQYCELAAHNKPYGDALNVLEDELVTYTCDVAHDEQSHELFINAFLSANGFADQPGCISHSSEQHGARGSADRLTNLMKVTVDTS
ncbi:MAG: hypothetical protein H0X34_14545 [Chthoniobacterales bacterium]|nr:hypothetical protein [Chthoniobacterales bacterium]